MVGESETEALIEIPFVCQRCGKTQEEAVSADIKAVYSQSKKRVCITCESEVISALKDLFGPDAITNLHAYLRVRGTR